MPFDGQRTGPGANIRHSPPAEFTDGAQGLGGSGHQAGSRIYRRNELARGLVSTPTYRCAAPRADRHGGTRQARLARVPLSSFAGLDGSEDGGLVRAGRLGGLGKGVLHGVAYRDAAAGVVVARSPATIGPMVFGLNNHVAKNN